MDEWESMRSPTKSIPRTPLGAGEGGLLSTAQVFAVQKPHAAPTWCRLCEGQLQVHAPTDRGLQDAHRRRHLPDQAEELHCHRVRPASCLLRSVGTRRQVSAPVALLEQCCSCYTLQRPSSYEQLQHPAASAKAAWQKQAKCTAQAARFSQSTLPGPDFTRVHDRLEAPSQLPVVNEDAGGKIKAQHSMSAVVSDLAPEPIAEDSALDPALSAADTTTPAPAAAQPDKVLTAQVAQLDKQQTAWLQMLALQLHTAQPWWKQHTPQLLHSSLCQSALLSSCCTALP